MFDSYEKQLSLGEKFLLDMEYEEAIVAFNKAIEIEPKSTAAYIGLAETYISRLGDTDIDSANDALSRGYEQTQSLEIIDAYVKLSDKLIHNGELDLAIELLQKGYNSIGVERLREVLEANNNDTASSDDVKKIFEDFIVQRKYIEQIEHSESFADFLDDPAVSQVAKYALLDIDKNDIPELILNMEYTSSAKAFIDCVFSYDTLKNEIVLIDSIMHFYDLRYSEKYNALEFSFSRVTSAGIDSNFWVLEDFKLKELFSMQLNYNIEEYTLYKTGEVFELSKNEADEYIEEPIDIEFKDINEILTLVSDRENLNISLDEDLNISLRNESETFLDIQGNYPFDILEALKTGNVDKILGFKNGDVFNSDIFEDTGIYAYGSTAFKIKKYIDEPYAIYFSEENTFLAFDLGGTFRGLNEISFEEFKNYFMIDGISEVGLGESISVQVNNAVIYATFDESDKLENIFCKFQ